MSKELLPIEAVKKSLFDDEKTLDGLLAQIEKAAQGEINLETEAGRKDIASRAYAVSRSKTVIDDAGKAAVADWKAKAKAVDDKRKKARDFLDNLRDKIREPLTKWEAEKAQAEAAEQARIQAELEAKERAERERLEAEQKAKREEMERREAELAEREAKLREAEAKAAEEKRQAEEAKLAQERAEKEAVERAKAAEIERKRREEEKAREIAEAEQRARQKALAEAEAKAAEERAEREKAEAQRQQKLAEERAAKEKSEHRAKINTAAIASLVENGVDENGAKEFVKLIAAGMVPQIQIIY